MPPKSSLTSSFSVSDANNEVVCPLRNHDGSSCRKRCVGEKRYRSMQEHIRRAHPDHYIAKLPATEESFALMVNTPPSERPPPPPQTQQQNSLARPAGSGLDADRFYRDRHSATATPRTSDELRRTSLLPAASAAAALAQLHHHRPESDWDSEQEANSDIEIHNHRSPFNITGLDRRNFSYEKHSHHHNSHHHNSASPRPRELLPSSLARSPPGRSSTLPPIPRSIKPSRPRKSSITQNSRRPKHERTKSKGHARRISYDRKAFSAEPQSAAAAQATTTAAWGKRWEDLIDAATSANEEESNSRDLTPVPLSPHPPKARASLPPFAGALFASSSSYIASPLQRALTPPPPDTSSSSLQPFPSVESTTSTNESGQNFHFNPQGLPSADSSPAFQSASTATTNASMSTTATTTAAAAVQIYCAACRRLAVLKESYACTECICGLCQECVDVLVAEQVRGRVARCPRCGTVGGRFRPFQLEIR